MFIIQGKYNKAKVFATTIENECISQITDLCNQKWLQGCQIAIMPDTHAGKGATIGTTITLNGKVSPSLVGADIGCGMLCIEIPSHLKLNLEHIDNFINQNIPFGFNVNDKQLLSDTQLKMRGIDFDKFHCLNSLKNIQHLKQSIGSLGSGNHFLEINESDSNKHYLVVHSGSRNLGQQIAKYYQKIAYDKCNQIKEKYKENVSKIIKKCQQENRVQDIQNEIVQFKNNYQESIKIPYSLCYLEGEMYQHYLEDMQIANCYASLSRKLIAKRILDFIVMDNDIEISNSYLDEFQPHQFEYGYEDETKEYYSYGFETIHNYIGQDNILRKGAISAKKGEKVIIPINMRDGSIIGLGKGNPEYNYSGPHGAGRLMSRSAAKDNINMKDFIESMKGIHTSSVCQSTIDESPMAYKPIEEIFDNIQDTIEVLDIIKPIYNFKAH